MCSSDLELPSAATQKLLALLQPEERKIATDLLGYPKSSIGRRMASAAASIAKPLPAESSIAGVATDLLQKLAQNGTVQTTGTRPAGRGRDSKRERRAAFLAGS